MTTHRFILTLGSNVLPADPITWACERLQNLLPSGSRLRFSRPKLSAPIAFGLSDAPFTDVVGVGQTTLSQEAFAQLLKALEQEAGRTPEQRLAHPEVIPVDIDLILWDDQVLKPKDLDRPYLHDGLKELGEMLL